MHILGQIGKKKREIGVTICVHDNREPFFTYIKFLNDFYLTKVHKFTIPCRQGLHRPAQPDLEDQQLFQVPFPH